MKKRRILIILSIILLLLVSFAAYIGVYLKNTYDNYENLPYPYDNFKLVSTLEKKDVDEELMISLRTISSRCYMDGLLSRGFAGVIRYHNGGYYSITPLTDGRYLLVVISVDEGGNTWVSDYYYVSELCDRKTFDETVKIGMPMEEVLALDPNVDSWERTVDKVTDYYSKHRFNDRSAVSVHYVVDEETYQPVVADITELTNSKMVDNVLEYLLPWDLALITK